MCPCANIGLIQTIEIKNMETKKCAKCGRVLPVTEFHKCTKNSDGLYSYCKECARKEYKNWKARQKPPFHVSQTIVNDDTGTPVALMDKFTTQQLLDELRKRGCTMIRKPTPREMMEALRDAGYTGKLQYTEIKTVDISAL